VSCAHAQKIDGGSFLEEKSEFVAQSAKRGANFLEVFAC